MRNRIIVILSSLVVMGLLFVAGSTASFGEETSPTATPILGDADCNGEVNIVDALKALRFNVGLEEYSECMSLADADCDVDIDIRDAMLIMRFGIGSPIETPNCAVGEAIPTTYPGVQVLDRSTFQDRNGRTYTIETVVPEQTTKSVQALASSGIRSCWAERWVKNAFGQKLATLRHTQQYYYNGSFVWLYTPIQTHSSMLGWDVNNIQRIGPYHASNYSWGYSYHTAEFKLKDPFLGWTLQSVGVYAGTTARANGTCYYWWG